ncbi:MAG: SusD/RagB family nutrient-binding outer membrane lipoprotein [Bacteroidales bacterium]|nr:SusD/RagB family nutrient-binding outer membrane lipoprotein [Bacteroidales bacterium]
MRNTKTDQKFKQNMRSFINISMLVLMLLIVLSACKKNFEEINTNPQGFTTASNGSLFNAIIESLILTGNEQFYINNEILYKQTQLAALTRDAWGNFTLGTESMWGNYYQSLPNFRELERRFNNMDQTPEVINMKAMLKIVLAYKTFKLTDIFGDMPFTYAGYGFQDLEYLHPPFDTQKSIYLFLLEELEWCDENIDVDATTEEPFVSFSAFDRLFNADMLKWQKFGNSLRLRYALRMSEKEPELGGEIIRQIVEDDRPLLLGYDFITFLGESACIWPASMGFKNESLNWSFREHENLRMGSNIWHQLSAHDSTDGSGIFDPRAYIFFETNNENEWVPYPQLPEPGTPTSGGIPYDSHRDQAGAYQIKGETNIYSIFNYFIVRDEDFMPIPLITGAEVHYILAEAYFRGIGLPQSLSQADIEYMNGINTSIDFWMQVAENSRLPLSGLSFTEMINIPPGLGSNSVLNVFGSWNAATDEEKLRFIYAQRWLDHFRQPWEAYALARRTNMTPREGETINHFRMPYPPSEAEYNSANWSEAIALQGGDEPENKLWWIP